MSFSTAKIKRAAAVFLLTAALAPWLRGQGREEAARLLGKEKNYAAAAAFLEKGLASFPEAEKAEAAGLLAFCANRMNDPRTETRWIVEYFDTYKAADPGYAFLDLVTQSEVIGFINGWRAKYPWVMDVSLIKGVGDQVMMPEGILPLVIEIANAGLYKFSENGNVLKAGTLNPGFNIIALDANALFLASGRHVYRLEIKAGNLLLSKEIALDVDVSSSRARPAPVSPGASGRPLQYRLTLYIGGEAVLISQKAIKPVPLTLGVKPNQNPFGFKPDYVLNRNKPNPANSFSIIQAIGILYSLLRDLFAKKGKKDAEPPKIQTVQDLTLSFRSKDYEGRDYETMITLRLRTKNLPFVLSPP